MKHKIPLFDNIIFSKTNTKQIEPILNLNNFHNKYKLHMCFIDNKKYNYKSTYENVTIYFINCDTYKYYYTPQEIVQKMDYNIYDKLNKKIVYKYLKSIYKIK